jgi:hypothetical protein
VKDTDNEEATAKATLTLYFNTLQSTMSLARNVRASRSERVKKADKEEAVDDELGEKM